MTILGRITPDATLSAHDRFFARSVLSPFADDLARRVVRLSIGPLLEIAAGTGVLTQPIASALSAETAIVATDPNAEVVAHAKSRPGMTRVSWQVADPHELPFQEATFGVVACQFRVATLGDPVGIFKQARRVMKQGGRFMFNVPGALRYNPVAACVQAAMDALFPADPPRLIADGLHGYANNEVVDADLTEAGFTDAIYTVVELPFVARSAREVANGYCLGTSLRTDLELRTGGDLEAVVLATTHALEARFGTGPIESSMRAHVISAAG